MLKDFLELLKGVSLSPVQLSLELAAVTTLVLLLIGLPLSWWLARGQSRWCPAVNAVVTLPLVLPPSVLGFYILVALGPNGPLGMLTESLGLGTFNFSFPGLVIGSVIYSMPFMVQPLVTAFEGIGDRPMEVAATLRCHPFDAFINVVMPLARPGGEFGVVLMIGGNIPGKTQVVSTEIYTHVEAMEYAQAHVLAGGMLIFSFIVLMSLNLLNKRRGGE